MNPYKIDEFDVMLEAFYGKDKRFLDCEKALADLRSMVQSGKYMIPNLSKSEPNKALEATLCDIFGFKKMMIHWDVSKTMLKSNFTLPTAHIIRGGKAITKNLEFEGKPYDKTHTMVCVMDLSQALFEVLTDAEILAVIIHETGHNFEINPYAAIQQAIMVATVLMSARKILNLFDPNNFETLKTMLKGNDLREDQLVAAKKLGEAAIAAVQNLTVGISLAFTTNVLKPLTMMFMKSWDIIVQKIPGATKLSNMFGYIARALSRFDRVYLSFTRTIQIPSYILKAPFIQANTFATLKGEKFSDAMAAAFGYGVPLSSAVDKLQVYLLTPGKDYYKNSSKFKKFLFNLGEVNAEILQLCTAHHGSAFQRTGNMLKSLKASLEDTDLTSDQKAELKKEIAALEEAYNGFMQLAPGEKVNLVVALRSFLYKYLGGDFAFFDRILPDLKLK